MDNARRELEIQGIDDAYCSLVRGMFAATVEGVIETMRTTGDPSGPLQAFARTLGQIREVRATVRRLIDTPPGES